MGEQVGIQPRVRSQNNSRVLENAFRNVLRGRVMGKFSVSRLGRALTSGANFRRGEL